MKQTRLLLVLRSMPVSRRGVAAASTAGPSDDPAVVAAARPLQEIPGLRPFLGTGIKYLFGKKFVDYSLELYKKYGPVVYERLAPGVSFVRVFDPDDMAFVYRNEGTYPQRFQLPMALQYSKDRKLPVGLANEQGETWQRLRNTVNKPMLRPRAIGAYLPAQNPIADDLMQRIRKLMDAEREVPDLMREINQYAMEAVGVVLFDRRLHAVDPNLNPPQESQRFIEAAIGMMAGVLKLQLRPPQLYKYFPMPAYTRFCKDLDTVAEITEKYMLDTLKRDERGEVGSVVSKEDNIVLGILRSDLSTKEALMVLIDLFFAAVDTTSNAIGFSLYHLASNPAEQEKLYNEIQREVPKGTPVTEAALTKMPFLKACVKETLRMTPIAILIPRILEKDIALKGYRIPAGQPMMMQHGAVGHLESAYDEPDRYLPERWLRDDAADDASDVAKKDNHPFATLPFGFGKRMCIGRRLAEQEIYLIITKILQNFRLEYHHEPIGVEQRFVNTPDKPLRFTFIERQ